MSATTEKPAGNAGDGRSADALLFDKLYAALVAANADLLPLDSTDVVGSPDVNRATLMARKSPDGTPHISEKFRMLERVGEAAGSLAVDTLTTHFYLGEEDELVVAARETTQERDEKGMPIPGQFTGPQEYKVIQDEMRAADIMRITNAIVELTQRIEI